MTILAETRAAYVAAQAIDDLIEIELIGRDPTKPENLEFFNAYCRRIEATLSLIRRAVEQTEKLRRHAT